MKIILKIFGIILILLSVFSVNNTFGAEDNTSSTTIKVSTSIDLSPILDECHNNNGYYCDIPKGFTMVNILMGALIKYFTFLAGLGGVLYIVINGILYSMSGMDQSLKDDAKKRITKTIIGLIVLLMSGVILHLIAPWVYTI